MAECKYFTIKLLIILILFALLDMPNIIIWTVFIGAIIIDTCRFLEYEIKE